MEIEQGGPERVLTPALRRKLYELFDAGASINVARAKITDRISRTVVGRTHKAWRLEREIEASNAAATTAEVTTAPEAAQLDLGAPEPAAPMPDDAEPPAAVDVSEVAAGHEQTPVRQRGFARRRLGIDADGTPRPRRAR